MTDTPEPTLLDKPESILQEAERIVNGPRAQYYGPPAENFQRIADLWNGYLLAKAVDGNGCGDLTTRDVAALMALMKLARLMHTYHRDSVVDLAGYAACMEKLEGDA